MGMFTKDKLYGGLRLDDQVRIGGKNDPASAEPVLLLDGVIVSDEVPTELGNATKTALLICQLSEDGTKAGKPIEVNTLAMAVADKVRQKEDGDLPAVVCFFTTEASKEGYSDATVMQFVRRWDGKTPDYKPLAETVPF